MELGQRDAEHFAYIFVKAVEDLLPNDKIFIKENYACKATGPYNGYADPFWPEPKIYSGNCFKAYLPPKSVISLTHVWTTNCLDIFYNVDEAKTILQEIVNKSENLSSVSNLVKACKLYLDYGDSFLDNTLDF